MAAAHLPVEDAYRLGALQSGENGESVLVVAVEFDRILFRRLERVSGDVDIVVIMESGDIPIVNLHVVDRLVRSGRGDGVVSCRETVVDDVSALVVWEHKVAGGLEEVLLVGVAVMPLVIVVGIHIASALILADVDKVHFHNAVDWAVQFVFHHFFTVGVVCFMTKLNLHCVSRSDADHVHCRSVVSFLELSERILGVFLVLVGVIVVDVVLLDALVRHTGKGSVVGRGGGKLTVAVAPHPAVEIHIRRDCAYIEDIV